jgi:peptide/nickel transport system permease protein
MRAMSKKLIVSASLLATVHLLAIFAGFIAPYNYATQHREQPYMPPSKVHWYDPDSSFRLHPYIYKLVSQEGSPADYREDRSEKLPVHWFVTGDEYRLLGIFHCHRHLFGVNAPANLYLLGSDGFGRDQFSRVLYGAQVSLFSGLIAALLALGIGFLLGGISGFYGGLIDDAMMAIAEISIALPWLYLLIAVRAFLPLQINPATAFLLVIAVIGIVGWGRPARLVRGMVMTAKERNFVLAARGFGASKTYRLRRHILPQVFGVVFTQAALLVPQFILAEVTLSFLGLGVGEPFPSWGNMLASAQHYHVLTSYWWMLIPAVLPIPLFAIYHTLADALDERLRPSA